MNVTHYHALTERLKEALYARDDVIALMALGSMAGIDRQPDEYSDHDFFVITQANRQQHYRDTTDWLPYPEQIILHFQETAHGCKAIYNDAHLLEYAIFDREELKVARINSYAVLFSKVDLSDDLKPIRHTELPTIDVQRTYDAMLSNILVGSMRAKRGEKLSATTFIKQYALTSFITLCWQQLAPDSPHRDTLDPMRRFEQQFPQLATDIEKTAQLPVLESAKSLLRLVELFLSDTVPDSRAEAIDIIAKRIATD
ncbi:MAG: hypothetical protein AAF846_17980 [Chloroflexota bacterium]